MKQTEFKPCAICGKGMMHDGSLAFYRVKIEHLLCHPSAIQRQHGLELMLGSPVIAFHMGLQEDLAQPVGEPIEALICQDCGCLQSMPIAVLAEKVERAKAEKESETE